MRDREATDVEQLYRPAGTAEKYLEKVYVGNVSKSCFPFAYKRQKFLAIASLL